MDQSVDSYWKTHAKTHHTITTHTHTHTRFVLLVLKMRDEQIARFRLSRGECIHITGRGVH